jgi:DNA-binding MarR family transcriptional regulator
MKGLSRFDLFELVRDATDVTGAQLSLLYVIAWRANPIQKYSCYLSTERLVKETHYSPQNLRMAAKKLEEAQLIKREKRTKRSTIFFLNVPLLAERAQAARKKKGRTADPNALVDHFNVRQMALPSDDADNTDGLDDPDGEPEIEEFTVCESIDDVAALVAHTWEAHPSSTEEHSRSFLMADLGECVQIAGGPRRCGALITHLTTANPKACRQVAKSRKLGRYLVKMFPIWLAEYADALPPEEEIEETHQSFD